MFGKTTFYLAARHAAADRIFMSAAYRPERQSRGKMSLRSAEINQRKTEMAEAPIERAAVHLALARLPEELREAERPLPVPCDKRRSYF